MRALKVSVFLVIASLAPAVEVESGPSPGSDIIDRYVTASQEQQAQMRDVSMEVDIDARIPKLKKQGRLRALRNISKLGGITYRALSFVGDKTIKNDVIARYLTAETHAVSDKSTSMAITRDNYKFKYKGRIQREGRELHVFHLTPRKKRLGLFKGELWVDASTFMPLREAGRLVKNPSLFLKKVEFVRDYEIRDGIAVPRHIQSTIQTRLVGAAQLDISFSNFAKGEKAQAMCIQPVEAQ